MCEPRTPRQPRCGSAALHRDVSPAWGGRPLARYTHVRIAITLLLLAACHAATDTAPTHTSAGTAADSMATSCASGAFCDGVTGLCAEEPVCSAASPCATATVNGN